MQKYNRNLKDNVLNEPFYVPTIVNNFTKIFSEYRSYFLACIGSLILIVFVFTGLHFLSIKKKAGAYEELFNLEEVYQSSFYKIKNDCKITCDEINTQFMPIINKFGKNEATKIAKIILGNISYESGDFENAIILYLDILQNLDHSDSVLKNIILTRLAYSYLSNKNSNNAKVYFEQVLSENESIMKREALFNLALIDESKGKFASARKMYEQFLSKYPKDVYTQIVKQRMKSYNYKKSSY